MLGLALAAAGAWPAAARAQETLPVPTLDARVVDQTGTLGPAREALDQKLADVERTTGSQIVVLMVPTTQPEDIASYAYRVADAWKIGRRDVGDGILVVVAKDDRHVRIEVAKALEGAVPDLAAHQIIDRALRPAFKAGDYAGGLSSAVDQLAARIGGEGLPQPDARQGGEGGSTAPGHGRRGGRGGGQFNFLFIVIAAFVAASVLKAVLGRTLGSLATGVGTGVAAWVTGSGVALVALAAVGGLILAALAGRGGSAFTPGFGRRGGGLWAGGLGGGLGGFGGGGGFGGFRGGSGGGGFRSGGGGDFGGGGASGGW